MYYVYLIECADGSLYAGITTDVERRFAEHLAGKAGRSGRGARYTSARKPVKILYTEERADRSSALKREAEIKSWPRAKKLDLIKTQN